MAELARANAPWEAAAANLIDKVIDPTDTRAELVRALRLARGADGRVRSRRRQRGAVAAPGCTATSSRPTLMGVTAVGRGVLRPHEPAAAQDSLEGGGGELGTGVADIIIHEQKGRHPPPALS